MTQITVTLRRGAKNANMRASIRPLRRKTKHPTALKTYYKVGCLLLIGRAEVRLLAKEHARGTMS